MSKVSRTALRHYTLPDHEAIPITLIMPLVNTQDAISDPIAASRNGALLMTMSICPALKEDGKMR